MDRQAWLAERRAAVVAEYDEMAAEYESFGYPVTLQETFIARLVETVPRGGVILDAPCGTGKYFARVATAGRRVVGIDQSTGMLAEAARKGIAETFAQVGLQALAFDRAFDAVMTVDAMENVPPEDWPTVLANLRRAIRPGAPLYITVEELRDDLVEAAFADSRASSARGPGRSSRAGPPGTTTTRGGSGSFRGSRSSDSTSSTRRTRPVRTASGATGTSCCGPPRAERDWRRSREFGSIGKTPGGASPWRRMSS